MEVFHKLWTDLEQQTAHLFKRTYASIILHESNFPFMSYQSRHFMDGAIDFICCCWFECVNKKLLLHRLIHSCWLNDFFIRTARDINGRDFSCLAIFASVCDYLSLMTRKMNSNVEAGISRRGISAEAFTIVYVSRARSRDEMFSCLYRLSKLSYDSTINVDDYSQLMRLKTL